MVISGRKRHALRGVVFYGVRRLPLSHPQRTAQLPFGASGGLLNSAGREYLLADIGASEVLGRRPVMLSALGQPGHGALRSAPDA